MKGIIGYVNVAWKWKVSVSATTWSPYIDAYFTNTFKSMMGYGEEK